MVDDVFAIYINEIKSYKLLTSEEELNLSKKIASGDEAARERLINANLRLVVSVAGKFSTGSIPVMDLIQEGNMGLMAAAAKFNYSFNTRFSTYAYSWILQYMLRYIHAKNSIVKLPARKRELVRRINSTKAFLQQKTGKDASEKEIAEYLGISADQVNDALDFSMNITSLDASCGENGDMTIGDMVADSAETPEESVMKQERKNEVANLMHTLSDKEKNVIYHRYNFENDKKTKTLREIGEILGVSAETVRQMEIRAIHRMKITAEKPGMKEILLTA